MHRGAEGPDERVRVLILGLGNRILGDDGAGSCFAEALSTLELPQWIRVVDGGLGGMELLEEIENSDVLFLVDSASPEEVPRGDVRVYKVSETLPLSSEEIAMMIARAGSHGVTPEILLAIALTLGKLPKETYVVGIGSASIEIVDRLSSEARGGCVKALRFIEEVLRDRGLIIEFNIESFRRRLEEIC